MNDFLNPLKGDQIFKSLKCHTECFIRCLADVIGLMCPSKCFYFREVFMKLVTKTS